MASPSGEWCATNPFDIGRLFPTLRLAYRLSPSVKAPAGALQGEFFENMKLQIANLKNGRKIKKCQ
jgi:hypothetical protein